LGGGKKALSLLKIFLNLCEKFSKVVQCFFRIPSFTATQTIMKKAAQLLLPALALLAAASAQAQTTVSSGYVQSVGAGTVTLNGGGLLAVNDTTFTVNNNIVLGTNGGLFRAYASVAGGPFGIGAKSDGRLVINGSVSGSGGVSFQDGGQMQFKGSNSYTGNTTFDGASGGPSVDIGNVNAFSGSTVVIDGFQSLNFSVAGTNTYNFGGLSAGRNLGLGANTLSVGANNENNHYYGVLSGTGGFVKVGSGTQTLSGPNSFTGGTIINNGTLALGFLGSNDRLTNSGAVTVNGGAFNLGGFSETVGAVTLAGGTITNGTLTGSSYDLRSGSISAVLAGNAGITKSTEGTVILSGSNTYSGATTISAGTLQVGNGGTTGRLGSNTNAITNNGTLAFNRSDTVIFSNSVTGSGGLSQIGTGTTTSIGNNSYTGNTTVSAGTLNVRSLTHVIGNGTGQSTNLLVNGGILNSYAATIGQDSNTFGLATINSGTWSNSSLRVGDYGTGSMSINGGNVLTGAGQIGASAGSIGSVSISSGTFKNDLALTVGYFGSGSLTISGGMVSNSYAYIGSGLGSTGSVSISSGTWNSSGELIVGGYGSGSLSISGGSVSTRNGSGTVTLAQAAPSSGTLNLGDGGSSVGTLLASSVTGGSGTATVNVNSTGTANLGHNFTGSLKFNQIGTGTTVLTGSNAYTGITTISDGTLQVGNGGTQGTLGSGTVVNNGALAFNRSNGITLSNAISGSGSLAQNGIGTLRISGSQTYTGGTVINAGTLVTRGNETLADSGAVTVNSGGTFMLGGNETIASLNGAGTANVGKNNLTLSSGNFSGVLAGSGDLYKTGADAFTLSGTSLGYTGDLYLQGGSVVAGSSTALNANNFVLLSAGSTFTANQNLVLGGIDQNGGTIDGTGVITSVSTITRSGALNSVLADVTGYNSGVLKLGTGTTTLGAANTYTGTTKVSEGTLALGANGSFASASSAQIASGATLDLAAKSQTLADAKVNGTVAGSGIMTVTGTLSGSGTINADTVVTGIHSPGNSPGIQSFNGNLTYQSGAGILLEFADNTTVNSPVAYDQINVGKDLNFSGLTSLNISFGETGSAVDWNNAFWQTSQSWTLYSVNGLTTGFENLTLNSSNWSDANGLFFSDVLSGGTFSLAQNGNNVVLNYAIPEPSTYALMGLGALALVIAYRRKRA
jgi:autotransporter-associated beta strand protein/T5SS/PEP-CTERM-associated repeat protein